MDFWFIDAADHFLFIRNDAEQATHTVDEMTLDLLFAFDPQKQIQRGMRVGFNDETGVFQCFEVRRVRTYEPDHTQEVHCEHIAISELTDEHFGGAQLTGQTSSQALTQILTGTLWSLGTSSVPSDPINADLALGSVWQNVRTIEQNWNVYITPRVVLGSSGIIGRYLDITPAGGTFRGIRLSLDKNADEVGVTIDDTETLTALYGYGGNTDQGVPLTFATAVWTETSDHPAKPAGQIYLEDPSATAAFGRNGRARFGFYQNADITDPSILLQKTWEALKATNKPKVTVDCMVRDLYRKGYADQPIRLHDQAIVEIRPSGIMLQLEIIRLTVDLLDWTATRPTIGAYIPNIVYLQRMTAEDASGGISDSASGRRGGGGSGGKNKRENEISEFQTSIAQNQYQITLKASQVDLNNAVNILKESGIAITSDEVLIYSGNIGNMDSKIEGEITERIWYDTNLQSQISVNQNNITVNANEITLRAKLTQIDSLWTEINSLKGGTATFSLMNAQSIRLSGSSLFKGTVTINGTSYNVVRWGSGD